MLKYGGYLFVLFFSALALILSGCASSQLVANSDQNIKASTNQPNTLWTDYTGEQGQEVFLTAGEVKIPITDIKPQIAKFFNLTVASNKKVYFFIVQDKNGTYRAAANACQVCGAAKKGFHQAGNNMICGLCRNAYPLEKIATEKGGCNPVPISPDLKPQNGNLIINVEDLEKLVSYF